MEPHLRDTPQKSIQENYPAIPYSDLGLVQDISKRNSDSWGSEVLEGKRFIGCASILHLFGEKVS